MPIHNTTELKLSTGRTYLRCEVNGKVSGEDATELFRRTTEVVAREGVKGLILSIVAAQTVYTPESRRVFTGQLDAALDGTAIVVTSTIVRAAINFMVLIRGDSGRVRFFNAEPEAIAWLESRK